MCQAEILHDILPENKWICLLILGPPNWGSQQDLSHICGLYSVTKDPQKSILKPWFSILHIHAKNQLHPLLKEKEGKKRIYQRMARAFPQSSPVYTAK